MDVLRLGKMILIFLCFAICDISSASNVFSFGVSVLKPIQTLRNDRMSLELFGRVSKKHFSLQTSFGYENLKLDKGLEKSPNYTSHVSGNMYNRVDGYFFRIGMQKHLQKKMPYTKKMFKFYLACNTALIYYRQELKVKFEGSYIDNVYSYKNYASYVYSLEPEFGFVLLQTKNNRIRIEYCSRIGCFLKSPSYPRFTNKLPGINNIYNSMIYSSLVNFNFYYCINYSK